MLHTVKGIVLRVVEYSESSLVVTVYTDLFGMQAYMVQGTRKKKGGTRPAHFEPLSLVEMVVHNHKGDRLNRIKEIKTDTVFHSIPFDISKQGLVFFINEVLVKSIPEEEADSELFSFLFNAIQLLDVQTGNCANFHLVFMLQLSRFLGFYPAGQATGSNYFDLLEGSFTNDRPVHVHWLAPAQALVLYACMAASLSDCQRIVLSGADRSLLLDKLVEYYQLHLSAFRGIRSTEVLKAVFE